MSDPGAPPPREPASMRELDLDDRFWRDALDAARAPDTTRTFETRYPAYARALEDLARQADEDATLIGVRFDGDGRNPRLLAFLSAALLARAGLRAVLVDMGQDLRWLERLTGLDLKQGLVDHVHYGVPLERCVRDTAMPGLAVLTGGTRFLAGSPLEDAPAVRGALDRLKQHFRVVVIALPSSEPVLETGVVALCDALLTVRGEGGEVEPLGHERLVIGLVGDPQAADDLAMAAHRFVGPVPALLAGAVTEDAAPLRGGIPMADPPRSPPPVPPASRPARETEDDLAFLNLFEEKGVASREGADDLAGFDEAVLPDGDRRVAEREWPERRRRRVIASLGVMAVVIGGMVLGGRLLPRLELPTGADETGERPEADGGIDRRPIGLGEDPVAGPGAVVPLDEEPLDEAIPVEATPADGASPGATRPAPYSLHVGSFQSERSALETAARLERAGWTAFLAPVALEERGSWHRVYAGTFADSTAADEALRRLLARGLVPDGAVRTTPLTFLLGTYPSREEADRRRSELRERGIPAYVTGSGPARVYAGAYSNAEESRLLEGSLHAAAEDATLTTRVDS